MCGGSSRRYPRQEFADARVLMSRRKIIDCFDRTFSLFHPFRFSILVTVSHPQTTANFKVSEQVLSLADNIFGYLRGTYSFAGVSSFGRVILNLAKGLNPKSVSDGWTVLN